MGLTRTSTTHLAGIAIPIEDNGASFFRYSSLKCWHGLSSLKEILPGLQVGSVIMGEDQKAFLIPQLPDASRPFADSSCCYT